MNEERRLILEMLKEGTISVEEAERLMEALPKTQESEEPQPLALEAAEAGDGPAPIAPKRIRIQVRENGKNKVNVRVPFSLVRVGLKLGQSFSSLGAKYVDEEGAKAMEMLKNIDVDELLASISDGEITLPYAMVDVDDEDTGESVLVVLE